jgi:uncharacterized protein (DUF433 family)
MPEIAIEITYKFTVNNLEQQQVFTFYRYGTVSGEDIIEALAYAAELAAGFQKVQKVEVFRV